MSSKAELATNRASNAAKKVKDLERGFVRKGVIGLSGAGLALAEKKGMPLTAGGVPIKLAIGGLATLGELLTRGGMRNFCGAIADSNLAIYSYEGVKRGSYIAGDDDDET